MGFGKSFKKIASKAGQAVAGITGSEKAGAFTAGAVGPALLGPFGLAASSASINQYLRDTAKTPSEDLTLKETQAQLAQAQQQAILSQEDLKRMEEEKRKQIS